MISLPVFLVLSFTLSFFTMPEVLAEKFQLAHQICLQMASLSTHGEFTTALVCGSPLSDSTLRHHLILTGLYHLVVVSCAHLSFLDDLCSLLPKTWRAPAQVFLWTSFAAITQFQAPILRALLARLLAMLDQHWSLGWSPPWLLFYSTILTMGLLPQAGGLSLQLSALAGGALLASAKLDWIRPRSFQDCVFIWMALIPPLWSLSPHSPITILCNWGLAPIFGLVLFPLGALSTAVPAVFPFYDFIVSLLIWVLALLAPHLPSQSMGEYEFNRALLWLWAIVIWASLVLLVRRHRHQQGDLAP